MKVPKLTEIAVSWFRSMNPTEEQQIEAQRRLEICETCPENTFLEVARFHKCNACGCPISKKVFSPDVESCPLRKWNLPVVTQ